MQQPHNATAIVPMFTRPRTIHRTLKAALACGLAALSLAAAAQPANQAAGQQQSAVDSFRAQATQLGVKSCANLFATLGNALTAGARYASNAQVTKDAPNDHPIQSIVGMQYDTPNYKGQAAGVVLTSPTQSGCEGNLVRVAPFAQSCPDVVRLLPPGSSMAGNLSGTPLYNLGGNQGQALLVSSGSACVVVTVASAMDRR